MTLKQSAEQGFLNKSTHRRVPALHSTKFCHHNWSVLIKSFNKEQKQTPSTSSYFLFYYLVLKDVLPFDLQDLQPAGTFFSVCMYYDANLSRPNTASRVNACIDLSRVSGRDLIAVLNHQWNWEKSTLKLLTLTLHLVSPRHMGNIKLQTKVCQQWSKNLTACGEECVLPWWVAAVGHMWR